MGQIPVQLCRFFANYKSLYLKERVPFIAADETAISSVYLLKQGIVKQYAISNKGDEVILNMFRPLCCFPLVHMFPEIKNHHYYETVSPVEIIRAPIEKFVFFIKQDPSVLFYLSEVLGQAFFDLSNMIECFMLGRAHNRVVLALLMSARKFGEYSNGERKISIPLTHKSIGALVGLTRETVSREMERLEEKKVITKKGGLFCISNMRILIDEALLT